MHIPFGQAKLDEDTLNVLELQIHELAAFINFIPNSDIIFQIVTTIAFSGASPRTDPALQAESDSLVQKMREGGLTSEDEVERFRNIYGRWIESMSPLGVQSLAARGLVVPMPNNDMKTHRILGGAFTVLSSPAEHFAYRATQVSTGHSYAPPLLRSSLFAVQSTAGDWFVCEHYIGHNYVRIFVISAATKVGQSLISTVKDGIVESVTTFTEARSGDRFRPYSIFLTRGNDHGSSLLAAAQSTFDPERDELMWYTPYEQKRRHSLIGDHTIKFGNPAESAREVAEMSVAPYTQLDIRNGVDGWHLLGDSNQVGLAIIEFLGLTMHTEADHIPDTIPESFFEQNGTE